MRKMRGLSVQSGRWVLVSFALLAIPGALAFLHGCSSGGGSHKKGKVLKTIEVTPASPSLAKGTSLQLTATGIFADKSKQDLTASVVWSSSDTNVAGVGVNTGLVNGALAGTVTIVATKDGVSGSQTLTVTNAALVSIDVTPALPSIAKGTTQQFTATGLFTDATTQDLTTSATWSSSNAAVATVSNAAGSEGLGTGVDPGTSSITAAFGLVSGSTTLTVTAATLVSIDVTPASPSIAKGTTQQFTATGVFTDASTQDLTTSVSWASSDTAVATISNTAGTEGLATSAAMGSTTVTATSGAVSGSTTLTVTAATLVSIDVTPASPSVAKGTTQQFTATGSYTDASTQDLTTAVTWSSSDTAVATISNAAGSEGLATGADVGPSTITATSGAVSGSTTLTISAATLVSIDVTPALPGIAKGTTQQFTATGVYTDASTQDLTTAVTWSSSDTAVATISNAAGSEGLATGADVGSSTITATSGAVSGSTTLTVTAATLVSIDVTPASPGIAKGTTQQFTATGVYTDASTQDLTTAVTWSSSDTAVATISNAAGSEGLATGADVGSSTITATSGAVSGSTTLTVTAATLVSIDVTPASPGIAKGTTQQFTATGSYTDASTQDLTTAVTWSSSDTAVATISNAAGSEGLATGADVGSSTITATSGAVSGSTTLTVTTATLVSIDVTPASPGIAKGTTQQFTATGVYTDASTQDITTAVTWSSSDTAVATISNAAGSEGLATGADVGSSTITATSGVVSGSTTLTVSAATLVSIDVTPALPGIAKGTTQQFTATGSYTDASTQDLTTAVTWSSSDTAVATISNAAGSEGLATGADVGSSTITATSGAVSGSTTLTVTAATLVSIDVTPALPGIAKGTTQQFTATGSYTDASTQDLTTAVTWSSSDTAVATISNAAGSEGLATGADVGSSTITATSGAVSGSTTLTVTTATLVSIDVTPASPGIAKGTTQQFTATGVYTDASTQDITTAVTWSSSDTAVATISNAAGSEGLATGADVGSSTITATSGVVSGSTTLTVSAATLVSIDVTPALPGIAKGTTQQFTATGSYTDASTQDLTTAVTWASSDTSVAVISNAAGSEGLATGLDVGGTTISATSGGVSGSTTLAVTSAELVSIDVTPSAPSSAKGTTRQFTATGVYTDSSTQDLTSAVTWASSDTAVATISNAAGSEGLATSADLGTTDITATSGAISGATTFTVTAATLVSIDVTPALPGIAKGTTQQFTATGVYTDASTQDLTISVTWASSDTGVATVSNAAGSEGLASGAGVGATDITATSGAVTGSTILTVTAAELVSIGVTPVDPSIAKGTTQQFTATGSYTDASTQDLTSTVTWSSSDTSVATVFERGRL
jgi:uncharacterized protein YjdB